jgi:molybdopterin converting factor small subunit
MGIRVRVRLYASLRKWREDHDFDLQLPVAISLREALSLIGVPENEVAIVMLNAARGNLEAILSDGDDIQLFPAIGGG